MSIAGSLMRIGGANNTFVLCRKQGKIVAWYTGIIRVGKGTHVHN